MAHRVFLSHAKEDASSASRVCTMLEADGMGCWLGERDAAAKGRAAANLRAIRDSDLVLLLFSSAANASATVLREIERAIAYEKPVLSIHLDDAAPNLSLEYYLNLWQWLDASTGVEEKHDDILAAVREQLAGTLEPAAPWRWLDAPDGVNGKRDEILAAVRERLASNAESAPGRETGSDSRRRWTRSGKAWVVIAGAVVVTALAVGLGLGYGLPGAAGGEASWTRLKPEGTVPHAPTAPITYDSTNHRVIVMVGSLDDPESVSAINTWAYDPVANSWSELKSAGNGPRPIISASAMNYDPITGRFIMFGGCDRASTEKRGGGWDLYPTAGTWAFDPVANTWADLNPVGSCPPARLEGATAFDPVGGRLILFGGVSSDEVKLADTWAYDPVANTWSPLKLLGRPPARSSKMVYDPTTRRMIMFGSAGEFGALNDTWAYDPAANTWTDLNPSGPLPPKRLGFGIAYDSSTEQVVMFGGCNDDATKFFNDTWAYDPSANTWSELQLSGPLPPACISSMVFDEATQQLIMFTEYGSGDVILNDVWALTR